MLKTWPQPMRAVQDGRKRFEFRRNDRGFAVGDILILLGYDPATRLLTGPVAYRRVQYMIEGPLFGIPDGFCIMDMVGVTPQEVMDHDAEGGGE